MASTERTESTVPMALMVSTERTALRDPRAILVLPVSEARPACSTLQFVRLPQPLDSTVLSQNDWLKSLKGVTGKDGKDGAPGAPGADGRGGPTGHVGL